MKNPTVSFLVPFRGDGAFRSMNWDWLKNYWQCHMPDAEIVVGHSNGRIFSKTEAVNNAAKRAKGKIFVIIDADCYIDFNVINHCVDRLLTAKQNNVRMWFIPYRGLYRLNILGTEALTWSDPCMPFVFTDPPQPWLIEGVEGSSFGHKFGALVQIMPREAFFLVGGMDPRFRGWGGEDVSFVRALDTLWAPHKNTPNNVFHLWHPKIGNTYHTRKWGNQKNPQANDWLAVKYHRATNRPEKMRKLVDEGFKKKYRRKIKDIFNKIFWRHLNDNFPTL